MDSPVTLTQATIDAYILYARDTKGLNFVALSEKDFDLSDTEWSDSRSRAAAFTSASFVAFSAFEWGDAGYGDFGHRPVYYLTDDQPLLRSGVTAILPRPGFDEAAVIRLAASLERSSEHPLAAAIIAAAQARDLGIPVREELRRLVVHGVLHVTGHDHPAGPPRVRSPMWRRQERYLARFGGGAR